jgi:hypothetical protein
LFKVKYSKHSLKPYIPSIVETYLLFLNKWIKVQKAKMGNKNPDSTYNPYDFEEIVVSARFPFLFCFY